LLRRRVGTTSGTQHTDKRKDKNKLTRSVTLLFGSRARGDWVEDAAAGYVSDFDIMVVVPEGASSDKDDCWDKCKDWARRRAGAGEHPCS
jgi:predicted nucleotidyltransferase